ncbi:hypothetical protein D3C81_1525950 [compost metagenome]
MSCEPIVTDGQAPKEIGRRLLHTRQVTCRGYLRDDGLFEFEGTLQDTKPRETWLSFKQIAAGEPVHLMHIVMTVDADFVIHDVRTHSEATPTPYCAVSKAVYDSLHGLTIGPSFKKRLAERVGGEKGCTHLNELLGRMATTVYQTITLLEYDAEYRKANPDFQPGLQEWVAGTCHAYREDGDVVRVLRQRGIHGGDTQLPGQLQA